MRHRLAIVFPFLLLSACGRGGGNESANAAASYELPGGGFDRARFRTDTINFCMARAGSGMTGGTQALACRCAADRLLESNDGALRAIVRDRQLAVRRNEEALVDCRSGGFDVEEVPPPEEPPPSLSDGAPPPVVGDGPAPGGGVPVPSGGRARARANLATYLTPDDYPAAALRNNEHGMVTFGLDIGPDGRVTNCRILESSGSAMLDSTTCRIMRSRARFIPARDARGRTVADRTTAAVTWALPPE